MGRTAHKKPKIRWKRYIPYYLMFLPVIIYMLINNYVPMFGILMAFQKVNFRKGMLGGEWVGFQNFRYLFATSDAWIITRNTVLYNLVFMILTPVIAITLAIFLSKIKGRFASKLYQTTLLFPYLMSMIVVSYLVYAFLNDSCGMLNQLIEALGGEKVRWYQEAKMWPFILTIVNIWHNIGFSTIIYLSAILGISSDYYEAARLDGASQWQLIRYITLPMLKSTVVTLTLLSIGQMFRSDFGLFYQVPLDTGILYSTTQTIDTYVFRGLMQLNNLGMSAAAGFYQAVVGLILILLANFLIRRYDRENALF